LSVPKRGPIGWGDAIIAANELGLQSSTELASLVELLGLPLLEIEPDHDVAQPDERTSPSPRATATSDWTLSTSAEAGIAATEDRRTVVDELLAQPFDVWFEDAAPLDPPPAMDPAVPYQPPIRETEIRAAIAALVQRTRPSKRIDIFAAVELIAEQRPLDSIPRLEERSTQRGAIVVADVGSSMTPYVADVDRFVAEVEHVVGSPNVTVFSWDGDTELEMQSDTPVLVISTLGAVGTFGSAAREQADWVAFADFVASAGADVVALVPHQKSDWPEALNSAMHIVAWDDLSLVGRGRG
jgi:hypothetical protein